MGYYQPHSCRLHYLTHMKEKITRIPENSELEQETTATVSEISSEEVQRDNPVVGIYRERAGIALQVYKRS